MPALRFIFPIFLLAVSTSASVSLASEVSEPLYRVRYQMVEKRSLVVGTIRSLRSTVISPRVAGAVINLPVRLGDLVQEGETLAELEGDEIRARLTRAHAEHSLAQAELARIERLIASGTATASNADQVRAQAQSAESALREAQTMVNYLHLRAPYAGVITARHGETGDFTQPGRPLLELADPTVLRLEAKVPESLAGSLHLGQQLTVRVRDHMITGPIAEIAAAADSASRSVLIKVSLRSDDQPIEKGNAEALRIGQFARVEIPLASESLLVIPASAIITRGQLEMVAVVIDDQIQLRLVRTGRSFIDRGTTMLSVVAGLSEDATILSSPPPSVGDGQSWRKP